MQTPNTNINKNYQVQCPCCSTALRVKKGDSFLTCPTCKMVLLVKVKTRLPQKKDAAALAREEKAAAKAAAKAERQRLRAEAAEDKALKAKENELARTQTAETALQKKEDVALVREAKAASKALKKAERQRLRAEAAEVALQKKEERVLAKRNAILAKERANRVRPLTQAEIFKIYSARLRKEAWIKAGFAALAVAFTVLFISSLAIWLTGFKFVWLSLILWAATIMVATPAFYFGKFAPSKKRVAQRMDAFGLEERMLTLVEFEDKEDSYMLRRQREDALAAINNFSAKFIKFAVSVAMVVAVSVSAGLGIAMTTVSALSAKGVIKGGNEIIEDMTTPELPEYEITYEVEGEGFINGELFLIDTVKQGEDGIEVVAEEMDGWAFEGWSDGVKDPIRVVTNVTCNMEFKAIFVELEEGEPGEGEDGEGGDESGNVPQESQPGDKPGDGDPSEHPPQNAQGSGQWEPNNQIIDGETFYGGSTFDNAYDTAMGETAGNGDISGDGQGMIGGYMNGIQQ